MLSFAMNFCANEILLTHRNKQTLPKYSQVCNRLYDYGGLTPQHMSPEPLLGLLIHAHRQTDRHVENNTSFRYRGWYLEKCEKKFLRNEIACESSIHLTIYEIRH